MLFIGDDYDDDSYDDDDGGDDDYGGGDYDDDGGGGDFTETSSEGLGGRLMESIKSVGIGFLLFIISFPFLWCNEGNAVRVYKGLQEGKGKVVSIKSDNANNEAVIDFIDNGFGISQDRMDTLFEPFSSGKDTGVGLGLAIVLSILKEHKGNIKVESKKGKGARFSVVLPLNEKSTGENNAGKDTVS